MQFASAAGIVAFALIGCSAAPPAHSASAPVSLAIPTDIRTLIEPAHQVSETLDFSIDGPSDPVRFAIATIAATGSSQTTIAADVAYMSATFSAVFAAADCSAAIARVRRSALANARTVATIRAREHGARVHALLSVREVLAGAIRGQCGLGELGGSAESIARRGIPADSGRVVISATVKAQFSTESSAPRPRSRP